MLYLNKGRPTGGRRTHEKRRRRSIFSCIGVGHTSTNRPLLAESTVLPQSSIALWCRVALSDCPIHCFWKKAIIVNSALRTVYLLLLRQWYMSQLVGQHGRAKQSRRCLVIRVKMLKPGFKLLLICNVAQAVAKRITANLVSNVQGWVLNMNYCTPVKRTTTFTSGDSDKWQPFRSRLRSDALRRLDTGRHRGNESAVVNVITF